MDCSQIAQDLRDEQDVLDEIVSPLADNEWRKLTPSPGWTVAHQIAHLTYFDESAVRAITDPPAFATDVERLLAAVTAGGVDTHTLGDVDRLSPNQLLSRWRTGRLALAEAAAALSDERRVDWYGPSMGAKSFLTARLMETWAHGQDVVDAVGATREPTRRLHHIARLGFITRDWSYSNRGLEAPTQALRVELNAPSGARWAFGPVDASETLTGDALDFCLVVTQRRHMDDTKLVATSLAREWLTIAQVFAGPPTDGPAPGSRP